MTEPTIPNGSIDLRFEDAIAGFGSVAAHVASPKENTPIIETVFVSIEGEELRLIATDRYTIGTYTPGPLAVEGESFNVSAAAAAWIFKTAENSLRAKALIAEYHFRVTSFPLEHTAHGSEVLVELLLGDKVERAQRFDTEGGNFPPVARLLKEPGDNIVGGVEFRLKGTNLQKFITSAKFAGEGEDVLTFEMFTSKSSGKPAPSRVSIGKFVGLIQPNAAR